MAQLQRYALDWALILVAPWWWFPMAALAAPVITVEVGRRFGEFTVINHGGATQLADTVSVEQKVNGRWKAIPVSNLRLRESCPDQVTPSACVTLETMGKLRPVPWTGNFCSSQCPGPCRLDGPVRAGVYRFVVSSCDGHATYPSPEFIRK